MTRLAELAADTRTWPFEQARALQKRIERHGMTGDAVIFQTGYGPSGLPHIGTFGEVARTSMVRLAFNTLTDNRYPTRLIAFSDDMDGFRKVPTNLPNQDMLQGALGLPLSRVPDPFGEYESFAAHNNARLRAFLDQFGFDYEFASSTDYYTSGRFDETLLTMLERFDEVMAIMLPTLGPERRQTYSPFLPISPKTGHVLQVPTLERNVAAGTIVFVDEDGKKREVPVTGGAVKVQWKPDWALRWKALGVDYEMSGKDLIESVRQSSRICKVLGGRPPEGFNYELFLDERGEKISKSRGNGISVEQWLKYATPESLALFNYQKPKTAKRLYFDVIPRTSDEYLQHLAAYPGQDEAARLKNPVWYIHDGKVPEETSPIAFSLLLNLASAASAHSKDVLWGFIARTVPGATPQSHPLLDRLAGFAVAYYQDFVLPNKQYRTPTDKERAALADLRGRLAVLQAQEPDAATIQNEVYAVGKEHAFEPLRSWFGALYEVLLGQKQGPRFGSFVAIYGIGETLALIDAALSGALHREPHS